MWPLCTANSFWWLLLPLLIGFLVGWWVWARRPQLAVASALPDAPLRAVAPVVVPPPARDVSPPATAPVPFEAPVPVAAPVAPAPVAAPVSNETPPVVAPPVMAPVAVAAAVSMTALGIPAAIGAPDDLLQIKGVGPKLNALLISLDVRRFDQIAAWGSAEIAKVDSHLGSFKGRIVRDNWVEQAGYLATGNIAAFEARYGKLDSENRA